MIRVLLAEDQGLMRSSLATLLGLEPDFEVEAVGDGDEALRLLRAGGYDVALLDIQMPGMSGLDIVDAIYTEHLPTRPAIVTTFPRPGYIRRVMDHGAAGFLIKDRPIEELIAAVRAIADGQTVLDNALALRAFSAPPNPLSAREIEVLRAVREHATIEDIALSLHLSHSTARNYLSSAIQKLGASNRAHAAQLAEESGWV